MIAFYLLALARHDVVGEPQRRGRGDEGADGQRPSLRQCLRLPAEGIRVAADAVLSALATWE